MGGPRGYHTKWSKSERERQIYDITYMWNLFTKQKQTHSHREKDLWLPKRSGCGGVLDWEFGISRCKLLYIEWINNKVLLYNTGNYIQYSVINENEKEPIYLSVTESLLGSIRGSERSPKGRSKWLPMPVFLPGKSYGQREESDGYSSWSFKSQFS